MGGGVSSPAPRADNFPRFGPAAPRARASRDPAGSRLPAPAARGAALRRRRQQRRWQRRRRRQRLLQPHTQPPNWTSDGSRTPGGEHPAGAGEGGSARGRSWGGRGRPGRARGARERERGQLRAGHLRGLGARRSVEADTAEKYFFLLSVRGGRWMILLHPHGQALPLPRHPSAALTWRACPDCGATVSRGLGSGAGHVCSCLGELWWPQRGRHLPERETSPNTLVGEAGGWGQGTFGATGTSLPARRPIIHISPWHAESGGESGRFSASGTHIHFKLEFLLADDSEALPQVLGTCASWQEEVISSFLSAFYPGFASPLIRVAKGR